MGKRLGRLVVAGGLIALLVVGSTSTASAGGRYAGRHRGHAHGRDGRSADALPTATPIKHLVVVFQENRSFDRYFGTYPHALNPPGEPRFVPAPGTPTVNGLTPALLTHNPNLANPVRLGPDVGNTCGSNHAYLAEQKAYDMGLVDKFVQDDGPTAPGCDPTKVMDYYDGNTVTALWNYAQHFSMSDNSFGTTFGPSHVGAINLVSGNNHGADPQPAQSAIIDGTQIGNVEPTYDDCPEDPVNIHMTGQEHRRPPERARRLLGVVQRRLQADLAPCRRDAGVRRDPHQQVRRDRHRVRQRQLSRSSTTSRPRTSCTSRPRRWRRSGTRIRPTISTT